MQPPFELSSAFAGCSLRQVSVFLRFIYCPDHATPGSLHGVHAAAGGLLAAVAGLAHRLDAGGLLAKIEGYLQGEAGGAAAAAGAAAGAVRCGRRAGFGAGSAGGWELARAEAPG